MGHDKPTLTVIIRDLTLKLCTGVVLISSHVIAQAQDTMVLKLKDVRFFKVSTTEQAPLTIKMSGLAFHSSLAVRDVSTLRSGETEQILVHLMPASLGETGNFEYSYVIPSSVNMVVFGSEGAVIWRRDVGIVYPNWLVPPAKP